MLRACLTLIVASSACGDSRNELEGSISEDFSLDFSTVDVSKAGCTLRVDYVKKYPTATYIACRIDIDTADEGLGPGSKLSGAAFDDNVTVSRISPTGRYFPEVASGTLELTRFTLEPGQTDSGSFEVTFDGDRDLRGRFEGSLRDRAPGLDCN